MARQIAKTASYGAMHLTVAVAVAYALSGDWRIALGIGVIEPAIQTVAYTVHEKIWANRNRKLGAQDGTAVAKG
ncbi:DUF2061 domain-containing protein [Rhodospirillaceae bacterium KN72]|uniref:DUF2061 domain-containing protein n=1 Tax=Pacificispira spongiicola TaxID=2729598 RepID=A0A7Y0DYW8_9PROT|nr:DUF2061 domain-containing protein [Pacificispira spongiicola]NMM44140.1 DUF2061 domain-containing protein [Pacificispira spongiicola]